MKKIFSLLSTFFALSFSLAQNYQGQINQVSESGLHQIVLSPEVRSASQNNLDFLRIFDAKNNEVPYVLFEGRSTDLQYENLTIVSRNAVPNKVTSVVVSNEKALNLEHLILKIANTDVDKTYSISGSNDNQEWFGLVINQTINDLNDSGKTSVERNFSFPLNNYKFLRFDFIDKNSLPINVLEVRLEKNYAVKKSKIELQNFEQKITTDKKKKQTKIHISFKDPQVIDAIGFDISAPNFYLREARIVINKTRTQKRTEVDYNETVSNFQLNSKVKNSFEVSELFVKEFTIEIDNQDNPELQINKISLFQDPVSILADLKANENYTLKIDSKLSAPAYDLAHSGIDFNQNYPVATISNLDKIDDPKEADSSKTFWQTSLFMWLCIGFAVLIIGYFAMTMIKDLNKEN
ncbi:hypothetical protein NG800_011315 [Epilithonimonas ginsengisoli]|uniref:DUF3999 family protein n=1 Tax=Epilithonimonas ginsengisoli TaxID=1245592 RepID=A0ABU4JIK9_9FLAO|nr:MULTISPECIES: hypothetical protein [Chryseobacterium group]MDW8549502.1 hypothetical protein [Epilithonimonas ginsengisoli]